MVVPMDSKNFKERLVMASHALGLGFQRPPVTQPTIDAPDAGDLWQLLQIVEELIRQRPTDDPHHKLNNG